MRIESVEMDNIRSYDSETVKFEDGLVLLYGENGAGKSSLLSSIFSGLYMSDVLKYMGDDMNLDSLVRRGCDEGRINLTFGINGDSYSINWAISVREDGDERRASTKSCTLTGSDIDEPVEGVRDVKQSVVDIMGLKPESFVNSVYVQQGDITRMVNASDEKRKEIIDGLLGLSKLDDYRERMDKARLEFGAQRRRINDLLDDKQRQMDDYTGKDQLESDISDLQSKKDQLEDKRKQASKTVDKFQKKILELQNKIDKYEDVSERKSDIEQAVEEKDERRTELADKKENVESVIKAIKTELEQVENDISTRRKSLGKESESLDELTEEIKGLDDELTNLENDIRQIKDVKISNTGKDISDKKDSISELKDSVESNKSEVEGLRSTLEDLKQDKKDIKSKIKELKEQKTQIKSNIQSKAKNLSIDYENVENLQDEVIPEERNRQIERTIKVCTDIGETRKEKELFQEIVESNVCPICEEEHDVVGDHIISHYEELEELAEESEGRIQSIRNQRDELDSLISMASEVQDLESKIEVKEKSLERKSDKISRVNSDIDEAENQIESDESKIEDHEQDLQDLQEKKSRLEEKVSDMSSERSELKQRKNKLDDLVELIEDKHDMQEDISDRQNEADKYEELRRNVQQQFIEKKRELKEVNDELDDIDIEESKDKKEKYEKKLSKLKTTRNEIDTQLSDVQEEIASKKQSLKRVKEIKSDINRLQSRMVEASQNETEAESVMQSYNNVKSKLREENIGLLNRYSNEIFKSVYDNKVYQQMKISKEYDITLVTGDGVEVDPKDLSGGERTIVSLAIRAGVYKLLVERQGSADTLPPFILDEPTTYLDDSHVSNLQSVIETITSWDVPQVLIVSHREDMIQNADSGYEVEKNPVSETSSVTKRY